jgi:hypothetical protein
MDEIMKNECNPVNLFINDFDILLNQIHRINAAIEGGDYIFKSCNGMRKITLGIVTELTEKPNEGGLTFSRELNEYHPHYLYGVPRSLRFEIIKNIIDARVDVEQLIFQGMTKDKIVLHTNITISE